MKAFYNEIDPFAAQWLRNLIAAGHIAPGDVDERSIVDIRPSDLDGYTQCHFFAGIGVWSHALRLAGWPDDRPVWTGSCPCQPFSAAGKGGGFSDERHLWPVWFELIRACKPGIIFGEQVASAQVVGHKGKRPRIPGNLSASQPSEGFDPSRQIAGSEEGNLFRFGSVGRGNTEAGGRWPLRSDWKTVQSGRWQDVGQPLTGSDRPITGLPLSEHSGGLPRNQQRDGGLGRAAVDRDGACDTGEAQAALERIVRAARESVDGDDAEPWLEAVFNDLEQAEYACGASVLPACGVGAPHIRQRLWWVGERLADANDAGLEGWRRAEERAAELAAGAGVLAGRLADANPAGQRVERRLGVRRSELHDTDGRWTDGGLADAECVGRERREGVSAGREHDRKNAGWVEGDDGPVSVGQTGDGPRRPRPADGFWRDADWLFCRDGKWRPVESGTFPLVDGASARVGRLRAYGNAIVAQAAETFIGAILEARAAA